MSHLWLPCSGNNKGDMFPTFLLLVHGGLATFNCCYQFDPDSKLLKWTCSVPFWLIAVQPLCLLRNAHGKLLSLSSFNTVSVGVFCWREGVSLSTAGFISACLAERAGKRQVDNQGISIDLEISLFPTYFDHLFSIIILGNINFLPLVVLATFHLHL